MTGGARRPRRPWAVDPVAARLIGDLSAAGASTSTIAAALNQQGRRTPEGLRWHRVSVERAIAELANAPDRSGGVGIGMT